MSRIFVRRDASRIPVEPMIGETEEGLIARLSAIHGAGAIDVETDGPSSEPVPEVPEELDKAA